MHAPDANQRIRTGNYRQFKFGMRKPTHQPIANSAQSQSSLSPTAIHPRRDGGASGNARAPTSAAARPAAAHSFNLQVAPSGAAVSQPFTRRRPCRSTHTIHLSAQPAAVRTEKRSGPSAECRHPWSRVRHPCAKTFVRSAASTLCQSEGGLLRCAASTWQHPRRM